jgi:hypothetical protein
MPTVGEGQNWKRVLLREMAFLRKAEEHIRGGSIEKFNLLVMLQILLGDLFSTVLNFKI